MQSGTFELLILVFIFLALQAWWMIPIVIKNNKLNKRGKDISCLLYTSPSPRDLSTSRMPSSA